MIADVLSHNERRNLRLARLAIYVFPMLAGLMTVSVAVLADRAGISNNKVVGVFVVNALLASAVSAYAVARRHPRERGKWWRVGASFLFAFSMSFLFVNLFGMCAIIIRVLK